MSNLNIYPVYFPNIFYISELVKHKELTWNLNSFYKKKTYRNRTFLYGPNGIIRLSIPVKKNGKTDNEKYICNDQNWRLRHWKTILNCYSSSPFFDFYYSDIKEIFFKDYKLLSHFNIAITEKIISLLNYKLDFKKKFNISGFFTDYEKLIQTKGKNEKKFPKYPQVFEYKYGFIKNLSILDLIFNIGPESNNYLNSIQ